MKYVIKNSKVYAIADNNYSDLNGKPLINNVELASGRSYSTDELNIMKEMSQAEYDALPTKNPDTYYIVTTDSMLPNVDSSYNELDNKPQINGVILTGNKSLNSLSIYSMDEVDNILASMRSIKVVATKPQPAEVIANTMYYVGSASPYHIYLYDSNKQEIDLGTSDVDFSNYYTKTEIEANYYDKTDTDTDFQKKTDDTLTTTAKTITGAINELDGDKEESSNKVTSISSSSTDTEFPSAKAVYDFVDGKRLYQHIFGIKYSNWLNFYGLFYIFTTNNTPFTYDTLAKWLYDNGFTGENAQYPMCSGSDDFVNRYASNTSGGSNDKLFTATSPIIGVCSPDGSTIQYYYTRNSYRNLSKTQGTGTWVQNVSILRIL